MKLAIYQNTFISSLSGDIRDAGSIPGSGRFPGGGNGNPHKYSCLESPIDRGAWRATVHRFTKSRTRLKRLSTQHIYYIAVLNLFSTHALFFLNYSLGSKFTIYIRFKSRIKITVQSNNRETEETYQYTHQQAHFLFVFCEQQSCPISEPQIFFN